MCIRDSHTAYHVSSAPFLWLQNPYCKGEMSALALGNIAEFIQNYLFGSRLAKIWQEHYFYSALTIICKREVQCSVEKHILNNQTGRNTLRCCLCWQCPPDKCISCIGFVWYYECKSRLPSIASYKKCLE